jgi:glutamine synthetase
MDGFANSYLAMAAILGAGIEGIMDKRSLIIEDCQGDPALMHGKIRSELGIVETLPKTLEVAMTYLDKDKELRRVLGDTLVDTYLAIKETEIEMLKSMKEEERRKFLLERY